MGHTTELAYYVGAAMWLNTFLTSVMCTEC